MSEALDSFMKIHDEIETLEAKRAGLMSDATMLDERIDRLRREASQQFNRLISDARRKS